MAPYAATLEQINGPRVALLTWAYPPEKSGLSRAAREIAQSLAAGGATVCVFTLDRSGREEDGAVTVIGCAPPRGKPLSRLRMLAGIGHLAGPLMFRRAVLAEHRQRPFDVVEATNWYAPALALTMGSGLPIVTRNSTPNAVSILRGGTLRDRIDRAAATALERLGARQSDWLISNTRAHGEKIAGLYGVTPPGAGHAVIGLSLPEDTRARGAAAPYPDGAPVALLFVGRDEPRKGFDALAAAVAILAEERADFRLTIVGIAKADIARWPQEALARTTAHHRVDEARLHALLAAAQIVVAPSRYESFGLVYQEAMAFGRPIVACAEDPSARLFVGESGAGVLAARCDGPALADALRPLIADADRRAALAEHSRRAGGRFTRETLGRETLAAYRSAVASKTRRSRASSQARAPSAAIAP